jgi:hypothetical protein
MKLTELIGRSLPFFNIHIGTPASPERIRELSRKLNIAFPPDYASVLSTYGSLWIEPRYGDRDPICVYGFAGSGKTAVLDIESAASSNDLFKFGEPLVDEGCKGEIDPKFIIRLNEIKDKKAFTEAIRQDAGLVPIMALDEGHLSRGPKELDRGWVLTRTGTLLTFYKGLLENPREPFITTFGGLIQSCADWTAKTEGLDKDIVRALTDFSKEIEDWLE